MIASSNNITEVSRIASVEISLNSVSDSMASIIEYLGADMEVKTFPVFIYYCFVDSAVKSQKNVLSVPPTIRY